jgi:hypothetical protein
MERCAARSSADLWEMIVTNSEQARSVCLISNGCSDDGNTSFRTFAIFENKGDHLPMQRLPDTMRSRFIGLNGIKQGIVCRSKDEARDGE